MLRAGPWQEPCELDIRWGLPGWGHLAQSGGRRQCGQWSPAERSRSAGGGGSPCTPTASARVMAVPSGAWSRRSRLVKQQGAATPSLDP